MASYPASSKMPYAFHGTKSMPSLDWQQPRGSGSSGAHGSPFSRPRSRTSPSMHRSTSFMTTHGRHSLGLDVPLVLPPLSDTMALAKGASRHIRSISPSVPAELVLTPTKSSRRNERDTRLCDPAVAESYGVAMLQDVAWQQKVFDYVDGMERKSDQKGVITRTEFASLASRMELELGKPLRASGFKFDFNDCDTNFDGQISLNEWLEYANKLEDAYGTRVCKRAAVRVLGTRKAENRNKVYPDGCTGGIYLFDGYNPGASLQLVRTCASASRGGNLSMLPEKCQSALEQRADPNCGLADRKFNGYTPLIFLAMCPKGNSSACHQIGRAMDLLVAAKADVHRENEKMPFGIWYPLDFAAQLQSRGGVEALLKYVDVGERFSWAASENVQHVMLSEMRRVCSSDVCRQISSMTRFDPSATVLMQLFSSEIVGGDLTPEGASKLVAGEYGDEASGIQKGARADPNGAGLNGRTALMGQIVKGHVETVKALLAARASPMQEDAAGATPLHLASAHLKSEIVQVLLEARADVTARDRAGFTPWMLVGECLTLVGSEERMHLHDMLEALQPETTPEAFLETAEKSMDELFADGEKATLEGLTQRLRLQESLFFDHRRVRRGAHEGRTLMDHHLKRIGNLLLNLLQTDPLKGNLKILTKYLLLSTMGPSNLVLSHIRHPWPVNDNREQYRAEMKKVVKDMLQRFGNECNRMRVEIQRMAAENPNGCCAALVALPNDSVVVPEEWQRESPYWRTVQERQLLRYDPEWARDVHDGATCCLALMRVGLISDLAGYSRMQQCEHAPMAEMLARGWVQFSNLCNKGFQDRMKAAVLRVAEQHGLDLEPPAGYVHAKKLKRLMEKTRMAREEFGLQAWPGLTDEYISFSHCFHILDTVRMSFDCNGYKDKQQETPSESSKTPTTGRRRRDSIVMESSMTPPEETTIAWRVNHRPPEIDSDEYPFTNTASDDATGYLGPDRKGTEFASRGDPDFYFVLDLGKECEVEKLEMVNAFLDPKNYYIRDYEIAISNDIDGFEYRKGCFPRISTSDVQDVLVMGTGRYIRMNFKTYGPRSIGIGCIRVIKLVDAIQKQKQEQYRKNLCDQVDSCVILLRALRSLTLEKDGVCVLRQKSGFSGPPGAGGYADVKLLCLADLGTHRAFDGTEVPLRIVGEVQLILQGYAAVKARMHLVYEVDRGSYELGTGFN